VRTLTAAERLLQSLGISTPIDIDLEAIAYDQGVLVTYRTLQGCEARIVGFGSRAIVTVDDRVIPSRRRFSTAHELGHWHYHRGRSFICRPDDIGNYRRNPTDPERVADGYAADLLMPRYLFDPEAQKIGKCTFEAVEALRKLFRTSITATAIRLVEFGPEPSMLVCHGKSGRRWFTRPKNIPEHWFPQADLDAESYAFETLHGQGERSRRALIGADAWFDRRGADRFELYEQSQKISEGEILTILVFKGNEMLEESTGGYNVRR